MSTPSTKGLRTRMPNGVYMPTADQHHAFLGRAMIVGTATYEKTVHRGKLATAPEPRVLNYNFDLLNN